MEKDNESIPLSLNNPDLSKYNTPLYKSQNSQNTKKCPHLLFTFSQMV